LLDYQYAVRLVANYRANALSLPSPYFSSYPVFPFRLFLTLLSSSCTLLSPHRAPPSPHFVLPPYCFLFVHVGLPTQELIYRLKTSVVELTTTDSVDVRCSEMDRLSTIVERKRVHWLLVASRVTYINVDARYRNL